MSWLLVGKMSQRMKMSEVSSLGSLHCYSSILPLLLMHNWLSNYPGSRLNIRIQEGCSQDMHQGGAVQLPLTAARLLALPPHTNFKAALTGEMNSEPVSATFQPRSCRVASLLLEHTEGTRAALPLGRDETLHLPVCHRRLRRD